MKYVAFLLIVWLDLALMASLMAMHAQSVNGPVSTLTPYGVVCTVQSHGNTLTYGTKGQWLYVGHFPYKWSLHTGSSTTYYQSGVMHL